MTIEQINSFIAANCRYPVIAPLKVLQRGKPILIGIRDGNRAYVAPILATSSEMFALRRDAARMVLRSRIASAEAALDRHVAAHTA
jgi:hypothetical protein